MSYSKQELTTHCEQHSPSNLDPQCEFCEMYEASLTQTV
jgi:hypothetical protein